MRMRETQIQAQRIMIENPFHRWVLRAWDAAHPAGQEDLEAKGREEWM